jgi:uncharacterized protein YdiU (UPF0061 family)
VTELPGDPNTSNRTRQMAETLFSYVDPTPTGSEPMLVIGSVEMAARLDLDPMEFESYEFPIYLTGEMVMSGWYD